MVQHYLYLCLSNLYLYLYLCLSNLYLYLYLYLSNLYLYLTRCKGLRLRRPLVRRNGD
ncbi:hypothetical protein PTT_08839 [Pyrenophora teres f. teres 0-1]|uniref:Uncharacterized protein n=1 Tax=Pyrenophora teres f. teres (strain 0-1) TaxID=861557 RepID=E3RKQ2_PYRTT|nr:hypothetical protein PTT_08839 [Pyrenophora teres f. teres 0-1]